jgi:nicotinamide-nucleotide amidase
VVTLIAEIVSIGTELLLGEIVDTNAAFLAGELKARGVTLYHKNVVGDNLGRIVDTLRLALSRADLVIVGGGLGPTDDDLSREAISEVAGERPTIDDRLLRHLRDLFESRGRSFPDSNRKQAWLIPSAETLDNPIGTAPGWFVRLRGPTSTGKLIVALPGPPREMQRMWREQVMPRLDLPQRSLWTTTVHTWGVGESHIAERLGDLTRGSNPSVATYARRHGVDVRVAASAEHEDAARALGQPVLDVVESALGSFVYGRDDDTLARVVTRELEGRDETVATVETGGALLAELLAESGSAAYAGGSVVTHRESLLDLGLTPVTLHDHGEHSEAAALELARGVRERYGASWGVAVLPATGHGSAPTTGVLAVSGSRGERAALLEWPTDLRTARERATYGALALLLREARRTEVTS